MKLKQIILLFTVVAPVAALAADDDDFPKHAEIGAMAFMTPEYEGADRYTPYYLPIVDMQYGPLFLSVTQGAGAYLPLNDDRTFLVAPAIRWRVKRNLTGESWGTFEFLRNIRPTATVNTIYKIDPWIFNFRITSGLDESDRGLTYNLGVAYKEDITDKLNLTVYATAIYGNTTYNQTFFGITESQSNEFGFDTYTADAGLKSVDIGTIAKYFITDHWAIHLCGEYMRLTGPAKKSPITVEPNQFLIGIGASYRF